MVINANEVFIDHNIPVEQQIAFLRGSAIGSRLDTYMVLKERLGEEGIALFKDILRKGYQGIVEMTKDLDFQTIANFAGYGDHMMGLNSEIDYIKENVFQYTLTYCPYLEKCRERRLDMEFCHIFEDVYLEVINKNIGELTEPERMCDGNSTCTFKMRNTLGK
jgi:hypothetical protein